MGIHVYVNYVLKVYEYSYLSALMFVWPISTKFNEGIEVLKSMCS